MFLSLITPALNVGFTFLLARFHGLFLEYIYSLGYPLFCGLILYFCLMYIISLVHIEETVSSSLFAFVCMVIPYIMLMNHALLLVSYKHSNHHRNYYCPLLLTSLVAATAVFHPPCSSPERKALSTRVVAACCSLTRPRR